jgi:hypothetical protein
MTTSVLPDHERQPGPHAVHVEHQQAARRLPPRVLGAEAPLRARRAPERGVLHVHLPPQRARHGLPSMMEKLSADPGRLLESHSTMAGEVPVRQFRVSTRRRRARC